MSDTGDSHKARREALNKSVFLGIAINLVGLVIWAIFSVAVILATKLFLGLNTIDAANYSIGSGLVIYMLFVTYESWRKQHQQLTLTQLLIKYYAERG